MNQHLQNIRDIIQQDENLSADQKSAITQSLKDADKELEIVSFKLDRTEKVKRTTAILLEETIEELEQKRKAVEAQNRELEIESSLEKVRTISMGMREPADMLEVCKTISLQLQSLGVREIRNVQTAIFNEQRGTYMNYEFYAKHDKTVITETTYTNNKIHEEFAQKMLKGKGEIFITHIIGDEVKDWIVYQKTTNVYIDKYLETASSLSYYWFSLGPVALGISTYHPLAEEEISLFKRFLKVFELAYQRYLDIEKAIEQAREAEIQLALERVRARSLAMHHTSELQDVVNITAQQLQSIGMEINGGVFICINTEADQELSIWASGGMADYVQKVIVPMLNKPIFTTLRDAIKKGNNFLTEVYSDNEKQEMFTYLFNYEPWRNLTQERKQELLARKGGFARSVVISQFTSISITNHHGKTFTEEENEILKRFGKVFEQSYIRFLDLQKAEAQARQAEQDLIAIKEARRNAEEALTELKATQTQLIHAEKMASLGELTAGIAHEIQNPLNFVNNFSEVSTELIDEMNQELEAGRLQSATEIANDIKQNLEKINYHGKRAGDIVKGMLQHSRASTGQKEPTDINALTDEYLRLAYHGLRAKDKSFNADFKTDFDPGLPKINIIPQDIGRVLLNLINNAFYAVNERNKKGEPGYVPSVSIITKFTAKSQLLIAVKDNGNGIPDHIKDKIFQPFFTTKPTGQGTGLGLSLSYDIVKAHNGEIQVASDDIGTVFTIKLPNQND